MAVSKWNAVRAALHFGAKGIAWDTCHKIYVLMDDERSHADSFTRNGDLT